MIKNFDEFVEVFFAGKSDEYRANFDYFKLETLFEEQGGVWDDEKDMLTEHVTGDLRSWIIGGLAISE